MDNLTEKLNQILKDPGSLNQIMEMAASLGLSMDAPPEPEQVSQALNQAQVMNEKHQALIHALLPYLKPNRQARLERAMQVAQMTQLAGFAMGNGKEAGHV